MENLDHKQLKEVAKTMALTIFYAMNWKEPMNGDDIDVFIETFKNELQSLNGESDTITEYEMIGYCKDCKAYTQSITYEFDKTQELSCRHCKEPINKYEIYEVGDKESD